MVEGRVDVLSGPGMEDDATLDTMCITGEEDSGLPGMVHTEDGTLGLVGMVGRLGDCCNWDICCNWDKTFALVTRFSKAPVCDRCCKVSKAWNTSGVSWGSKGEWLCCAGKVGGVGACELVSLPPAE